MKKFVPYPNDPFDKDGNLDFIPKKLDDASLYALFIKNFIATLYYYDTEVILPFFDNRDEVDQHYLYELYQRGELRIPGDGNLPYSPISVFSELQLSSLKGNNLPEIQAYARFIVRQQSRNVFQSIDLAVDYDYTNKDLIDVGRYISDSMGKIDHLEISAIRKTFEDISKKLVNQLKKQLIASLSIQKIDCSDFKRDFAKLDYALNNILIEPKVLQQVKNHIVKWFTQLLRHILYKINLIENEKLLDPLKEEIAHALNYRPSAHHTSDIQYPEHIFSNPNAYLLFQEIASRMDKKSPISFLYRKMAEKDNLIRVRDTEFRDWFNNMDYPIQLYSTTDTYERTLTPEREVFMDLLYEKYGLT